MEIKQLRSFLTVAETGSVTRAAEVLHLVQPAVTRQIQLLEQDIGTALFERERHGMLLTEAGRILVEYARRVMLEIEKARVEIKAASHGIGGVVTIGLLPSTIDMLSWPLVSTLATQYPGIKIRVAMGYVGTLLAWLRSGELDAALLYGGDRTPDVQVQPLLEEPLWVIGGPESGLDRSKPVNLKKLEGTPLVLPSVPHGLRTLVDHACATANIELQISAETNALSVQRNLVLSGNGLTILPPIAVADDLRSGRLLGAPLARPAIRRTIVLATPSNRVTGPHVRSAIEVLRAVAKTAVESGAWLEGRWL